MRRKYRVVAGIAHFEAEINISIEQGEFLAEAAHLFVGAATKHHAVASNRRNVLGNNGAIQIPLAFRIHVAEEGRYHTRASHHDAGMLNRTIDE